MKKVCSRFFYVTENSYIYIVIKKQTIINIIMNNAINIINETLRVMSNHAFDLVGHDDYVSNEIYYWYMLLDEKIELGEATLESALSCLEQATLEMNKL